MSFDLSNMQDGGIQEAEDYVGYELLDTGIYNGEIKVAYGENYLNDPKRKVINVEITLDNNGKPHDFNTRMWITKKETGLLYTETVEKDKDGKEVSKRRHTIGYTQANELARLITGRGLLEKQKTEPKELMVYDAEAKRAIPKMMDTFTEWTGKKIAVGIVKEIQDQFRQGVSTGKTVERNNLNKFYSANTWFTSNEIKAKRTSPDVANKWLANNKGKVINRSKAKQNEPSELETKTSNELEQLFNKQ